MELDMYIFKIFKTPLWLLLEGGAQCGIREMIQVVRVG